MSAGAKWYSDVESAAVRVESYKTPYAFDRPDIRSKQEKSIGTGFFVPLENQGDWYAILTCSHVIDNTHPDQISIIFPKIGKTRFRTAKIQCLCPEYDLGVLVIKITDDRVKSVIKPLKLATGGLPQGTPVCTGGFPLGHSTLKYTEGHFSGFSDGKLQHDAAISPGSSGGMLLNANTGEAIGVNSATVVGGGATSIHYAVPINLYRRMASRMLGGKEKVVCPPKLGFCFHSTTEAMLASEMKRVGGGGRVHGGVHIYHLFSNSPLSKAGVKRGAILTAVRWQTDPETWGGWYELDRYGDVLVPWNGKQRVSVQHALSRVPLDSQVEVQFIQDSKLQTVVVKPATVQSGAYRFLVPPFDTPPDSVLFAGLCVMNMCANHLPYMPETFMRMSPIEREKDMLVVTAVLPGYEDVPLQVGSVIESVNGKGTKEAPLRTVAEYRKALSGPVDGLLTIRDTSYRKYVLDAAKALKQENVFLEHNVYTPDPTIMRALEEKIK